MQVHHVVDVIFIIPLIMVLVPIFEFQVGSIYLSLGFEPLLVNFLDDSVRHVEFCEVAALEDSEGVTAKKFYCALHVACGA